jgi:parallel beta-helix repeat protein
MAKERAMRSHRFLTANVTAAASLLVTATFLPSARATVSCSGVKVASGSNIQRAIDSHDPGTTFCLSGRYTTTTPITPKSGDRFIGTSTTNISSSGSSVFYGGQNVVYANLGIGPSQGDGLRPGDGSRIRNSTIHDNPYCGIVTVGNSLVIKNNEIAHNGSTPLDTSRACGLKILGMSGSDSGAYSTITGNVVHDNGHNALWVDCNGHDNVFLDNIVYGNSGIALDAETSYGNRFRGNTVYRNGFGMQMPAVSILDSIGTVIRKNRFSNNYSGVRIWADRRATVTSPDALAGCADASLTGYIPSGISVNGNMFRTEQRVGFSSSVATSSASFDSNCYTVTNLSDPNWQLPNDATATWKQWRSAGEDPNGVRKTSTCS